MQMDVVPLIISDPETEFQQLPDGFEPIDLGEHYLEFEYKAK